MKAIIIYYSNSGKTEKLANNIKTSLCCDMLKIEPQKAYGKYFSTFFRVIKEKKHKNTQKAITDIPNLSDFDTVLIGYPIWFQNMPVFFSDFISSCDLKGKTIIPFSTFGGSGMKGSLNMLERICPESTIKNPYAYGAFKKDNYDEWLQAIKVTD